MITRFLGADYDVRFNGNSVAYPLCSNYSPNLCAEGATMQFLTQLAGQFEEGTSTYEALLGEFRAAMVGELSRADVWMCSIPAVWCRLLHDVAERQFPVFAYLGLPILQYVPHAERYGFLEAFRALALDERNTVVANNAYLAEEVLWQTGVRVPVVRIHGLHTNTTWVPRRWDEVLVSRPGTSGGWQECLLNQFVAVNPGYPLRFVQFTDLLDAGSSREVYNSSLSYASLAGYRAVVNFPYDTSLMLFWEFYSMGMPCFVPFELWRWGVFGQHTRKDLELPVLDSEGEPEGARPPSSPFFDGFMPHDVERATYWSKFTDWAMFPHVQYFRSLPDLMSQLVSVDLAAVSAGMRSFNEQSLVQSVQAWRLIVERWVHFSDARH